MPTQEITITLEADLDIDVPQNDFDVTLQDDSDITIEVVTTEPITITADP
jgi:hypothetical protein